MSDFITLKKRLNEGDTAILTIEALSIESFYPSFWGSTILTTKSGDQVLVVEKPQEILAKIEEWKRVNDIEKRQKEIDMMHARAVYRFHYDP